MPNSSLAFAFDPPSPPLVVTAAKAIASQFAAGRPLSRSDINRIMTDHFGGTDALGAWSVRDAHAALELAQVQHLQASDQIQLTSPIDDADQFFCGLDARFPTQTNRSDEQIELQQFATPPRLAWLAARACGLMPNELVLEPSAGTGMLAVWAAQAGTRLALQNAIFDEFMGLVEARIDAARQAGTLDLGLETIAVEDFSVLSDTLLRTDPASGATTHLLELEIARALKPLTLKRLEELHGLTGQRQRPVRNARSGRVALIVPARSILADDGTRVTRFELLRPLGRSHITEDQLAESSWEDIAIGAFREAWAAEVEEARVSHKRERLYLATGLLLPVWDKLPSDFVRVSRISAADGRSLLGREVPVHCVPELCRALGLEREQTLSADDIVQTVLATGRAMEIAGRQPLMVKRSLVNGSQRLELTGWGAAQLDWYKAHRCFTEIIRYQTRLFVPIEGAASVMAKLASSA